jgi:methylmalonyl-CoA/ethylmalonyl-CoA epimerase
MEIEPLLGRVDQIGIVVRELERAVERWARLVGGAPWGIWTYGPQLLETQDYRGQEAAFEMRVALSTSTPQVELIEPLRGPSLYHDWLEVHGPGLHHLGAFEPDLASGIERMRARGFEVLQSGTGHGLDGDGGFAYFDTTHEIGLILELIEVPARRPAPEAVWPPAAVTSGQDAA